MRAQPSYKRLNSSLLFILVLSLITACGKKNVVNSSNNPNSPNTPGWNPNLNTGGGVAPQEISNIIQKIQCRQGQRLNNVYVYKAQASGTHTTLAGPFSEGQMSGPISKLYVGVSYYNDVMIVSKITNGTNVQGYNVFLSYCSQSSYQGVPYISNNRPMKDFQAQTGIVLDEDNNCGYGSVDSAQNTLIYAEPIPYNYNGYTVQLERFPVWTTFIKPVCNGQY